jgi:hypothetical protein
VRLVTRLSAVAVVAITGLALTITATAPAVARPVAGRSPAVGGTRLWLARFGGGVADGATVAYNS